MTTELELAMRAAGVKLPNLRQRIWTYLHDRGPHTAAQIAAELGIPRERVNQLASLMHADGRLVGVKEYDRRAGRAITAYSAVGQEFCSQPGALHKADKVVKLQLPAPDEVHKRILAVAHTAPRWSAAAMLEEFTLSQLREIHAVTSLLFNRSSK